MQTNRGELSRGPKELTDEQRAAFEHTLASRDLVMDVSGIAGTGKSHFSHTGQESNDCRGQDYCNPFADRHQA